MLGIQHLFLKYIVFISFCSDGFNKHACPNAIFSNCLFHIYIYTCICSFMHMYFVRNDAMNMCNKYILPFDRYDSLSFDTFHKNET